MRKKFTKYEEQIIHEPAFRERGIATLAVDMAGTGEAPINGKAGVERMYDAVIT